MVAHLDAVTCLAVDPNGVFLMSGSKLISLGGLFPPGWEEGDREESWASVMGICSKTSLGLGPSRGRSDGGHSSGYSTALCSEPTKAHVSFTLFLF